MEYKRVILKEYSCLEKTYSCSIVNNSTGSCKKYKKSSTTTPSGHLGKMFWGLTAIKFRMVWKFNSSHKKWHPWHILCTALKKKNLLYTHFHFIMAMSCFILNSSVRALITDICGNWPNKLKELKKTPKLSLKCCKSFFILF